MSISFPAALPLTAYQQENKQDIATALAEAKKFLWDGTEATKKGKEWAICYALSVTRHPMYPEAQRLLIARLNTYGVAMLCRYLATCGYTGNDPEVIQASRHAWLDQMVKELRA